MPEEPVIHPAPTGPVCPQCGAAALPEQRYCRGCGAQLPDAAVAAADAVPRTPAATVDPAPTGHEPLVQTLATTTDARTRKKAALDLAARYSVEATRDLASKAETDDTAQLGLEALRDGYVQQLTALRKQYVAQVAAEGAPR